jgi:nitrite reductase/ring-hydroxylating ferredoxin subunit
MKRFVKILIVIMAVAGVSCGKNKYKNPYLRDVSFDIVVNLDLPEYGALKFPGSALYIDRGGIKGIIVYNTGNGYNAFEASDPNHYPNDCSRMEVSGTQAVCPCENNHYTLSDGHLTEGSGEYPMRPYYVERSGNSLHIYN